MPRQARSDLPSPAIYHVTARGVDRREIFLDDEDCRRFLQLLHETASESLWDCFAYTLMPNHYHLLVEAHMTKLSAGMRKLNGTYAQRFNEKYVRTGHLFEGRYYVRLLRDDEHFTNACEYIWNNPVAAGRCATSDEWPWSGAIRRPSGGV